MYRVFATTFLAAALITGCGGQQQPEAGGESTDMDANIEIEAPEAPPMRDFTAATIGPYEVQPMFEEEIEDGHYNIKIVSGGEVNAVRVWVGPEDASGVMVAKGATEFDYHHCHVELPDPLPEDAKLWIEIESPKGELFKGSTALQEAS
jgi:hypothetical protein